MVDQQPQPPLRVAYIWSQELQDVSDDLPSNVGRSSTVHGLVRALGLVEDSIATGSVDGGDDEDEDSASTSELAAEDSREDCDISVAEKEERTSGDERSFQGEKMNGEGFEAKPNGLQQRAESNALKADLLVDHDGIRRAFVIPPDERLGTKECLMRYHDKAYVEALLKHRGRLSPADDPTAPPSPSSSSERSSPSRSSSPEPSGSSSSSTAAYSPPRPSKRRRTEARTNTTSKAQSRSDVKAKPRKYPQTDPYNLSHDNPPFPSLPRYISLVAAATSTACRLLLRNKADAVCCWDGGRHHAKRREAGGFCYVNDLVLGCLLLSREGRVPVETPGPEAATASSSAAKTSNSSGGVNGHAIQQKTRPPRILYLDLDLHYSDGVSSAFQSPTQYPYPPKGNVRPPKPPSVLTLSVHHSSPIFFPPPTPPSLLPSSDTPNPFSLSVPLAAYPSSATYKEVWDRCIEPIQQAWNPDYVVLQLGADGLPGDRVGQYGNWALEGEGGMKWCVSRLGAWGKKVCITGGGGYNHPNAARAWAGVTASLLDRDTNEDTHIPHCDHFEAFEPSFTMEIPKGHMRDENTQEELDKAGQVYRVIAERIEEIVAATGSSL